MRRLSATSAGPGAPYPGTRPFRDADHHRFFGRESDSEVLLELWRTNRITLAAGPAASGKTSLLNAGLFPRLARSGSRLLPAGRISCGATFPWAALPQHNPYTLALLQSWLPDELPTQLVDLTVSDFIKAYAEGRGEPVFAAIDQVDDLLADPGPRWASRRKFLHDLADAARTQPQLRLLLIARNEATDLITGELGTAARYDLPALGRQGAIEAVRRPAAGTGRSFTDGSAEKLISDLQSRRIIGLDGKERHITSDSVEPSLIQVVCTHLWASLPTDTAQITPRDIRVFADADKALADHCGRIIASVADDHDLPVAQLRSWVLDTFITEQGTQGTAYEGPVATAGMPNTVARALEDRHLLAAEQRSGSRWYELLTARLIDPLLRSGEELPSTVHAPGYLFAAERVLARGEVAAADRYAHAALRASSDTDLRLRAEVESLLGNIAIEREKPTEAAGHYQFAASLFEALRDTSAVAAQLAAIGQTLVAQDELDEAVKNLQAARDRVPGDPVIQTALAVALWRLGASRAAVAILNDVLEMDGGNSVALRARGEILAESGDARKAISDLNRVTLQERPSTRAARGLALARLGDEPGANTDADDAVAEAPHNGTVLLYAARVKSLGGRPEGIDAAGQPAGIWMAYGYATAQVGVLYHLIGQAPGRGGHLLGWGSQLARCLHADARRMQQGCLGLAFRFVHARPQPVHIPAIAAHAFRENAQLTSSA